MITVDLRGPKKISIGLGHLPSDIERAKNSALKKVGYYIARKEVKEHIKTDSVFDNPSVLTRLYASRYKKKGKIRKRIFKRGRAFQYLAKMAKYDVSEDTLSIGWGYDREFNKHLTKAALRAEYGHYTKVTDRMRRYFGNTELPLRKSTKYLHSKKRPIINGVIGRVRSKYFGIFKEKFFTKLN
jgi:hypothetical protein